MESGLDAEMDEQLGYDRYDVKGKETDDSRNGHSRKTLRTSFGDTTIQIPRDRKGEFDPTILRKNQTSIKEVASIFSFPNRCSASSASYAATGS